VLLEGGPVAKMKALIQPEYGGFDKLKRVDLDRPVPKAGQVLVRVLSTSLHADIWHVMEGRPFPARLFAKGLFSPKGRILGTDLAGIVESVGEGVGTFQEGDAVYGDAVHGMPWKHGGTFAQFALIPASELLKKPENLSFEEAAALCTSGYVALLNLLYIGNLKEAKTILINGAGGAVGTLALQIAKAYGAHVTAIDCTEKVALLASLGANRVIDYTQQDFRKESNRYDMIFDVASTLRFPDLAPFLTEKARYVYIGHEHFGKSGGRFWGVFPRILGLMLRTPFNAHLANADFNPHCQEIMSELDRLARAGQLRPLVEKTFPLEQVQQAAAHMMDPKARGRAVLNPWSAS